MKYFFKWEPIKYGVSQGSILRPFFFVHDTSITITNADPSEFVKNINNISIKINNWFKSNLLSPNFDKTHFLQSITKIVRKMTCK